MNKLPKTESAVCLSMLKKGTEAEIVGFPANSPTQQRLWELGLFPGTRIRLVRFAPLGDPIEILVRGTRLCLRKTEAALIMVRILKQP